MAVITLHKFGILPGDENTHVFTFLFENPQKLWDHKSAESSEVNYGGHKWSVVCMKKEEKYCGVYLKWRYSDGQSINGITCKIRFQLSVIHRLDYAQTRHFSTTQTFSSSQTLLGRGKLISLNELLDLGAGYLDETGRRVVLELTLCSAGTYFEQDVDTSPAARIKKNASGYYYDTTTFVVCNHRWYLRIYPTKANAHGLPAVYLYLAGKPKGLSLQMHFRLSLGKDSTDMLVYDYGEGAKFDGFGKTLPNPLDNPNKITRVVVGVDIAAVNIWKDLFLPLHSGNVVYTPHLYNRGGSYNGYGYGALTPPDAFQDQEGNFWKVEVDNNSKRLVAILDKGVHHYQQSKTKLLCWTTTLLARDPQGSGVDIPMCGEPIVGYFSNFIDEKGYQMAFSIDISELEEKGNPYTDKSGEVLLRLDILSLQTIPVGMKSIPRFDYQFRHLLRARNILQQQQKSLEDMRSEAASRASLFGSRDLSDLNSNSGRITPFQMNRSYDSLDALSREDNFNGAWDDTFGKAFFTDLLRHVSMTSNSCENTTDEVFCTKRDGFHGTREDMSTESGITVSDESVLLMDARPSAVDISKQKETVSVLIKFLQQRLPIRISEIVEAGSLGTSTSTKSRIDVDLILFSPDLPKEGHKAWMPSLLHAVSNFIQRACLQQDPQHPLPACTDFTVATNALQFTCGGMDVDLVFNFDWESEEGGGMRALYEVTCGQSTHIDRQWFSLGSAGLQKKFIADQPNEVKEIIKIVKHWRNCIQWRKTLYRPSSYLMSLIVVKAVEDTQSTDIKTVLQRFGSLVLAPELSIAWSTFYLPEKYQVDFEPPTPLVRDPANPGCNVAQSLPYWGQFRTELIHWLKGLGIGVCSVPTTSLPSSP